jgi:hypothetical protein
MPATIAPADRCDDSAVSPPRDGQPMPSLRLLGVLLLALVLGTLASPAAHRALAAAGPAHSPGPRLPATARVIDAATAPAQAANPAGEDVATKRREIADYVSGAYSLPAHDSLGDLGRILPQGEAALAVQNMSAAEVTRLHDALPLIHYWPEIRRHMAAGSSAATPQPPRGSRAFTPAEAQDLEQVRADLQAVLATQESWAPIVGGADPSYTARIADGRSLVKDATLEDLATLRDALDWIPDWRQTLAPNLGAIVGPDGLGALAHNGAGQDARALAAHPAVTSEQCSDADRNRDPLPLIIASAVLRGTALTEDFAANFFTKDIKICVAIIGFSICVDFPNPVFFILKTIQLATNRAVDGLDAAVMVAAVCTSIDHWLLTIQDRDEFLVNAQGIMKSVIERNNELIERSENIDFADREAWKLKLELAIEENLLEPAPLPDGSNENRISLFQLTDSICFNPDELLPTPVPALPTPALTDPEQVGAPPPDLDPLPTARAPIPVPDRREQCGLELVKRLVGEAIQLNLQAGNDIHDAQTIYATANADLAAGHFAQAYLRYREAYRAAVQPDAEPRQAASSSIDR